MTTHYSTSRSLPSAVQSLVVVGLLTIGSSAMAQPHAPLAYHGGPVLTSFRIYPLYYGAWTTADITAQQNFLTGLAGYLSGQGSPPNQQPMLRQYGVNAASVGPAVTAGATAAAAKLSDSKIRAIVHANQPPKSTNLPAYGSSTLIIVFLAHGFSVDISGGCAYHASESSTAFYAAVPQDCGPTLQLVTGHEVFEAATDPALPTGWDEAVDGCSTVIALSFGSIPGAADNRQGGTCSTTGFITVPASWAYLWADSVSASSSTPALGWQFNSAAVSTTIVNTMVRTDVGAYRVTLPRLGQAGGTVHVTAYGSGSEFCKVATWNRSGADLLVNVRCFTNAGAAADSRFTLAFSSASPATQPRAFLWADQSSTTFYTPNTSYQFNSSGALNTMSRTGTGTYVASLPGLGGSTGHVQVTAYGYGSERCKVESWGPSGTTQQVRVRCFTATGAPADTGFTLSYAANISIVGALPSNEPGSDSAYLWSGLAGTPPLAYQFNSKGVTNSIVHTGTGTYAVKFPYQPLDRGSVQVTAYGSGSEQCKVTFWTGADGVQIRCFASSGALADSSFAVTFLSSWIIK